MAYSRHRPIAKGIGPFGTLSGSSTAARRAARSPARNAASILLNLSYSAHRSASDFILGAPLGQNQIPLGLAGVIDQAANRKSPNNSVRLASFAIFPTSTTPLPYCG